MSNEDILVSNISIYPNPAEEELFFKTTSNSSVFSIKIVDVFGKQLLTEEKITSDTAINIKELSSGIYFVSIKDEYGNVSVKKIVKG